MIPELIKKYRLLSDQVDEREVQLVLESLEKALSRTTVGDVVELGCYLGTTSLFISRYMNMQKCTREFHVYDSFQGLPEKQSKDQSRAGDQFVAGSLQATKKQFVMNYKKAGVPMPYIHKAWFHELTSDDVPSTIAFAFLDGDYYESILTSLTLLWPLLVPGAVVVIDDYTNEALPGVAKAVDEWIRAHPVHMRTEHSLAILQL